MLGIYPSQSPDDFHSSGTFNCRFFFSITCLLNKFNEYFWILNFLFIWENIEYIQLYTSWLNKVDVMKSTGRADFALIAVLNASEYSNGSR